MITVSASEIQSLDSLAIKKIGIPSIALMENAGREVAAVAIKSIINKRRPKILIVCGRGNNAGDGFVAARHLANAGVEVKIFILNDAGTFKHDPLIHLKVLKALKFPIEQIKQFTPAVTREFQKAHVVIDAIFGVGLNRDVRGIYKQAIECINRYAKNVLAVDTPSGLDATTGDVLGVAVRANTTVTFTFSKKGFYKKIGRMCAGKIVVCDIGIPEKLAKKVL